MHTDAIRWQKYKKWIQTRKKKKKKKLIIDLALSIAQPDNSMLRE